MKTKILTLTLVLGLSTGLLTAQDGRQRPEGPRNGPGGAGGPRMPNPLVDTLDLNHDGVIDADEIARASDSLRKLDRDGDGRLTTEEYRPQRPGGPGGPGGRGGPEGAGRRPGGEDRPGGRELPGRSQRPPPE